MAERGLSSARASGPTKQIVTFLLLTLIGSTIAIVLIYRVGGLSAGYGIPVFLLMWVPGLAALITSYVYTRSIRELGLGTLGPARYLLIGYFLPVAYLIVVYGVVWLTGLGVLNTEPLTQAAPLWAVLFQLATSGVAGAVVSAAGEEIGWRGLLAVQVFRLTTFTRTALITGAIWAVWHLPLLFAGYTSGTPFPYAFACFFVSIIGISFVVTYLRLASKSVWPCVVLHASHNLFIQGLFDPLTADAGYTPYVTTEFGIATAAVVAVVGVIFWRRGRVLDSVKQLETTEHSLPGPAPAS